MAQKLKFGNGTWATKEGSTLAYNDENEKYKPLPFSFERDSIATRVNKEGLIEVVGKDIPRIDYTDSTEGALLLEPSRSNIFDYSSDLSAWSKLNSTVTESSVLSLDGVNNSYGYERTSGPTSYIYRTVSLANTTQYTLSFFVKSGTSTNVRTDIWDTTQSTQCEIQVDLETKAISNFTGTSYKIEDYTNGWMRISVTFTSESSFGTTFNRYFNADSVGSELYIWGAQLESGNLSSYIPTNGSTFQRAAETCNESGNSEVFNSQEGVLFLDTKALSNDGTTRTIGLSDGSNSNRIHFINYAVANGYSVNYRVSNSTQVAFTEIGNVLDYQKIAFKYKSGDFSLWYNGFEIDTDSNTNMMADGVLNTLSFRQEPNSLPFYGKTKEIGYYDEILTDLELETLTSYRSLNEMVTELNLNAL